MDETPQRRLTLQEAVEAMMECFALSQAALVMTLHRQTGLSLAAVQADLEAYLPTHSDPMVQDLTARMLAALRHSLSLSEERSGQPLS